MLDRLPEDKSKSLFFERIFSGSDTCPDEFRDTKDKILKKCGGLPLAIVAVAGLLARDPRTSSHWSKVRVIYAHAIMKDTGYAYAMEKFSATCVPCT
jgi:disease resistance protein RPM1